MIKFAVISFPGTNCENETVRAFKRNGMDAEMVLWNDPGMLDGSRTDEFDGYCIAGGFSFEDRGRSGVVAAQEPITEVLKKEATNGKVILGICNGAQILVETGLIPGFDNNEVAIALTWNEMKKDGKIVDTGFYNSWVYLKNTAERGRSAFNDFDEVIHIPMAHGEGRFLVKPDVLKKLEENDQVLFKYADPKGNITTEFPHCPNGATQSIAALSNPAGNVMAMMPHPERDPRGNGNEIFESVKRYIEADKTPEAKSIGNFEASENLHDPENFDLEVFVKLIITDNAERTIEMALKKKGYDATLERYKYFGIKLSEGQDAKAAIQKIMEEGELANLNKELVYVRIDGDTYEFNKEKGLQPKDFTLNKTVLASEEGDYVGEAIKSSINAHAGGLVQSVNHAILWNFKSGNVDEVVKSHVLYNPNSMYVTVN